MFMNEAVVFGHVAVQGNTLREVPSSFSGKLSGSSVSFHDHSEGRRGQLDYEGFCGRVVP